MFDSLKYAKILEEAGIPRAHAETHIRVLSDVVGEEMVTKEDLASTKKDLVFLISDVRSEFKSEIADLRAEFKSEIGGLRVDLEKLENRMMLKMGSMMAGFMTLGIAATQILP